MNIKVTFELSISSHFISRPDFSEWLRYELRDNGFIAENNPLFRESLEPIPGTLHWVETAPYGEFKDE